MFKEMKIEELQLNPMTMIGGEWWLITAGNEETGYNAMTASWGHLGAIWERPEGKAHMGLPTAVVYLRPGRYTKEYMDREELFTLSVFDNKYKKEMGYLGSRSGRTCNKMEESEFEPIFDFGTTYYQQAKMVFVCKKLYNAPIQETGFVDRSIIDNNYPMKDFHEMYVGEIIKVLVKDDAIE